VDAKSSSWSFHLSGTSLLVVLTLALTTATIALDSTAQRLPWQGQSLTLPFLLCAAIVAAVGFWVVPVLQRIKAGQVIREDGPQAHLKKAGTPTMGGIFFVPVAVVASIILSAVALGNQNLAPVLAIAGITVGYGFIGWLDDWQILRRQSNKGISPRLKLALQVGFGCLYCLWLWSQPGVTTIALPFGLVLPLGLLFWVLAVFVLTAESNATNLTDGVDGLAAGTVAIALLGLGAIVATDFPGLAIFCACLSGSCIGFLVHNRNPARVFMGDTGSLALGGALAGVALMSNTLWVLFILSGIFFVESLSTIAQVSYYKATKGADGKGKRLFKMAPIHHHLELSGWSELQVVAVFYTINALLALVSIWLVRSIGA
jgi:phospho-N-acetylmuramoyl-pentapeptide-transferase